MNQPAAALRRAPLSALLTHTHMFANTALVCSPSLNESHYYAGFVLTAAFNYERKASGRYSHQERKNGERIIGLKVHKQWHWQSTRRWIPPAPWCLCLPLSAMLPPSACCTALCKAPGDQVRLLAGRKMSYSSTPCCGSYGILQRMSWGFCLGARCPLSDRRPFLANVETCISLLVNFYFRFSSGKKGRYIVFTLVAFENRVWYFPTIFLSLFMGKKKWQRCEPGIFIHQKN